MATGLRKLNAQQRPHYTQYILNNYIVNPALSGIENYTDVKLGHRHQWVGIQDAPVTTYFTVHGPIGKKDFRTTATSFEIPGENPRGKRYWEEYTAPEPHHGVGLTVINDKAGPINRFSALASYAYHIGINARTSLAAGFAAGISNTSLNRNKLNFVNPVIDPAVYGSGELNSLSPDIAAGLWLYSSDYFVGLSAQQIIPQKLRFSNESISVENQGKLVPHVFASAGYRFFLSDDISALPSVMVKLVNPAPVQFDLNVKIQYRDLLWAGTSIRLNDGLAAMVGVNMSNTFNLGYAYDYTLTRLNTVSRGTHELVLGFLIGNRFGDTCPRNVW